VGFIGSPTSLARSHSQIPTAGLKHTRKGKLLTHFTDLELGVPGPVALVGSGEFLPQMVDIDRHLLAGRIQRAAFLPTAAGEEGDASIRRWLRMGTEHYAAMGVEPVEVPVLNHDHANDPEMVELLNGVGLIYLSGGNPGYVAKTLHGSLVGNAIIAAWRSGVAIAGCSAGAGALTMQAPTVRGSTAGKTEQALGVVRHLNIIPHFDQMARWDPGFLDRALKTTNANQTLIGIDEDTALIGGLNDWTVMGRQNVTVFGPDGPKKFANGQTVHLPESHTNANA
jgi:cyanophycinase